MLGRKKVVRGGAGDGAPRILLASEGRKIPAAAVDLAAQLAERERAQVYVLSIARVWGSGLGLPMPGLLPSKAEWDAQNAIVRGAVATLKRRGVEAEGEVLGTRRAGRRILDVAQQLGCSAIVMGVAGRRRTPLIGDWIWSQEPYRVERRARRRGIAVHIVTG